MAVNVVKSDYASSERGDDDFAAVYTAPNGTKIRKLPIHDAAHTRNALARFSQTDLPAGVKAKALAKIKARAKQFKIEVSD